MMYVTTLPDAQQWFKNLTADAALSAIVQSSSALGRGELEPVQLLPWNVFQ